MDWERATQPKTLEETHHACKEMESVAWSGLYQPTNDEPHSVAVELDLHALAVEGAIQTHWPPKIARYDGCSSASRRQRDTSIAPNEGAEKASAWAAVLLALTLIGTTYRVIFAEMPELRQVFGNSFALLAMALVGIMLYGVFRRRGWLS